MKGDFTRSTFRPRKHYSGVRKQQGRVDLDADWNEQVDITMHRTETEAQDVIGRCGAPKHHAGFGVFTLEDRLETEDKEFLRELLRTRPEMRRLANVAPAKLSFGLAHRGDFFLSAGRYYVDGILCENEHAVPFTGQPDLRPECLRENGSYLVYLDVWQRHLTALDDPEIREVALGGPDTATRTKALWQVRTLTVDESTNCSSKLKAWTSLTAPSTIGMSACAAKEEQSDQPCILPPGAGFRRLENQFYRVEIHQGGELGEANAKPTFKWSRDNGSVAAAIEGIANDTITLRTSRRDSALGFAVGQWIELTDDRNEWERKRGVLVPLLKVDDLELKVDVSQALPNQGTLTQFSTSFSSEFHPKVRRWDSIGESMVEIPPDNEGFLSLEDGVEVKFAPGTCRTGDYWLIPARTSTRNVEWPLDANSNPVLQRPHGIAHHFCRLAIIKVESGEVSVAHDCRQFFPPLTEIENSCGCCTVTVGQKGGADYDSIQKAIDSLPASGGRVCVLAGTYRENIVLGDSHNRDIILIGCGDRSLIVPPEGATTSLLRVARSRNIRIESLAFAAARHCAIEVRASTGVTIRDCEIEMTDPTASEPAIFFQVIEGLIERNVIHGGRAATENQVLRELAIQAAMDSFQMLDPDVAGSHGVSGIQVTGGSRKVRVQDNLIVGLSRQGITLGSLEEARDDGSDRVVIIGRARDPEDPCNDCQPVSVWNRASYVRVSDGLMRRLSAPQALAEIQLARNRISGTGMDGIGVISFFDLDEADEFISVRGLTILQNEIRQCLRRPFVSAPPALADSMGYGGIALADVDQLVIRGNVIEDNGTKQAAPVCGIFVLHGEGIDISSNRILNNGQAGMAAQIQVKAQEKTSQPDGLSGGIRVVYALAPVSAATAASSQVDSEFIRMVAAPMHSTPTVSEATGFPALKVHDNIVSSPRGPALWAAALGPVSVVGNQFTSGSLNINPSVFGNRSAVFSPATVFILNLGVSNELYAQQVFAEIWGKTTPAKRGLDDLRIGERLVNGNVLFANNQCSLDLLEPGKSRVFTSLALLSLDDIGFHDNQCDCNLRLREDFIVTQALVLGLSIRVTGNRFKEGRAAYSAVTAGMLNTTAHNQATHCLRVMGPLAQSESNTILIEFFNKGYCEPELAKILAKIAANRKG